MKTLVTAMICAVLALALAGCDREQESTPAAVSTQPAKPAPTTVLLHEPLDLQRGETFSDALPVWRRYAGQKPTLLLLSNDPALTPPPEELRTRLDDLLPSASDGQLRLAGDPQRPNPLFLPGMSVDMALSHGWFRQLAWVFPQRDSAQELKLETLRDQLLANHMASDTEADSLQLDGKVFRGAVRAVPFTAAALPNLPPLTGPLVVHIDLSYFQNLYKNEIATPAITLVGSTLQQLAERNLPVLAATFSYSHDQSAIPMDVRFMGELLTELTKDPQLLRQQLRPVWQMQKDILYLENFFQKDEIRRLVERQAELAPTAAFVFYNRYHTAAMFKEGNKALELLAQAVAIDPIYANEYRELAERAYDAKHPDQALRMLKLASKAQPDNVPLKLQIARLAADIGDNEEARRQVDELKQLPWSPVYYPEMPTYLKQLAQ